MSLVTGWNLQEPRTTQRGGPYVPYPVRLLMGTCQEEESWMELLVLDRCMAVRRTRVEIPLIWFHLV